MTDRSDASGLGSRLLPSLAIGATVAAAYVGGRTLLERRRAKEKQAVETAERPADLAGELRGAAEDVAVALLNRATERLERANL